METEIKTKYTPREKIEIYASHLAKALEAGKDYMCASDKRALSETLEGLKGNPHDYSITRAEVKKAIKHARLYRDNGKEMYDVSGKIVDRDGLLGIIQFEMDNRIDDNQIGFLGSLIQKPISQHFSVRQISVLEYVQKKRMGLADYQIEKAEEARQREELIPRHKSGEVFSAMAYPGPERRRCYELLNFAMGKGLKHGFPPKNFLSTIKKWFDYQNGLQSLREALAKHKNRDLNCLIDVTKYEFVIADLERYFRVQEDKE